MLKLFYTPGACSLAPHIVLQEIGDPHELVRVNLREGAQRSSAYLAVNPKGRVPALQTEHGVLSENPAILAYLAQRFPAPSLAPLDDLFAFARMQAFNAFLAATVHVAFAHAFRPERYADGEAAAEAMRAKAPGSAGVGLFPDRSDLGGRTEPCAGRRLQRLGRLSPGVFALARQPRTRQSGGLSQDRRASRPCIGQASGGQGAGDRGRLRRPRAPAVGESTAAHPDPDERRCR